MAYISKVDADIRAHRHIILGERKVGKTAFTVKMATDHFGSIYSMYGISPLSEDAYEYTPNVVHSKPQTWDELMDIVHKLQTDANYKHFDMVAIDTINEIVVLAKKKVIDEYTKEHRKVPHSFQKTGWAGRDRARALIREFTEAMDKLLGEKAIVYVGHSKEKTIKRKTDDESYVIIDASLDSDFYDLFAYNAGIIGNIVSDQVEGASEDDESVGQETHMYFRDSGFVKAGTRITTVPEKMEFYSETGEPNISRYIEVVEEAVRALEEKEKAEMPPHIKAILGIASDTSRSKKPTEPKVTVAELSAEIIELAQELADDGVPQEDIMAIMNKHDTPNPMNIKDVEVGQKIKKELLSLKA